MAEKLKESRQEQKERRIEAILDAAHSEFVVSGFAGARLENIAETVGITKGAILFHFESKERLFEAAIQHILRSRPDIAAEAAAIHKESAAAELKAIIELTYTRIIDDPTHQDIFRLMISEAPRFPELIDIYNREFAGEIRSVFRSVFEKGVKMGEFEQKDFDILGEIIFGPSLIQMVAAILNRHHQNLEAFIDMHTEIILNGIMKR